MAAKRKPAAKKTAKAKPKAPAKPQNARRSHNSRAARIVRDELPPDLLPIPEVLARKRREYEMAANRVAAERWIKIRVPEPSRAFGIVWFGDPHLDDNGCNMPLLEQHIGICRQDGIYGGCVGDYRNNWVGRLVSKYTDQSSTAKEGRQLAKWFLRECGVRWAITVLGNHDLWNEGEVVIGMIAGGSAYIPAREARVNLLAGNQSWKVHVAHDFPGSSIYNKTHGPSRAAMFDGGAAELYVCGHRHTMAYQQFELEESSKVVHSVRARGYKFIDRYAVENGFPQGVYGASVMTVFNPRPRSEAGRIMVFTDPWEGADYLAMLRAKR